MSKSKKSAQGNLRNVKPREQKAAKGKRPGGRAVPRPAPRARRDGTKLATIVAMLRRPKGASIAEMAKATGWQLHSVRGLISGAIKKKLGLAVASEQIDGNRRYRIDEA